MARHRAVSPFVITAVMAILLPIIMSGSPAPPDGASSNYNFLVASGFLCDPNDMSTCPAVARAVNGDMIELSGAGTLNPSSKSITSAGAFTHKTSTGEVLETGV